MTLQSPARDFTFVEYDHSRVPQDPGVRHVIRQHAMRDVVATRRKKHSYGKQNRRQYPVMFSGWDARDDQSSHTPPRLRGALVINGLGLDLESSADLSSHHGAAGCQVDAFLWTYPADKYGASIRRGMSILHLVAPLAGLHLGIATLSCFTSEPRRLRSVFTTTPPYSQLDSRKLLSYIPSRYGQVRSLTHTTDCLVARLGQIVRPGEDPSPDEDQAVLNHYGKALAALQEAINDASQRLAPETLCAAGLLGIFELLNQRSETQPWLRHAAGAAQLIQLRGPDNFRTDFELSLFMAQAGPIVTEAFLHNKPCFLEEQRWKDIMYDAIRHDPSIPEYQHDLVYELWSHLVEGPRYFELVTRLILSPEPPATATVESAVLRIQQDRDHLREWLGTAQTLGLTSSSNPCDRGFAPQPGGGQTCTGAAERLLCPVLRGTYMTCCIIKGRLLSSLSPRRFRAAEIECQELSAEVMGLSEESDSFEGGNVFGGLFMAQTVWVARGTLKTKQLWKAEPAPGSEPQKSLAEEDGKPSMIEQWKFRSWCEAIGRPLT